MNTIVNNPQEINSQGIKKCGTVDQSFLGRDYEYFYLLNPPYDALKAVNVSDDSVYDDIELLLRQRVLIYHSNYNDVPVLMRVQGGLSV